MSFSKIVKKAEVSPDE